MTMNQPRFPDVPVLEVNLDADGVTIVSVGRQVEDLIREHVGDPEATDFKLERNGRLGSNCDESDIYAFYKTQIPVVYLGGR